MESIKKVVDTIDVKSLNSEEHTFIATVSAEVVDRDNEVVLLDGLDYTEYLKNPILTFMHRYNEYPIGRALWLKRVVDGGVKKLIGKFQLHLKTEESRVVWELIKDGFIKTMSIMFAPINYEDGKDGVRYWKNVKLMEIAVVTIPANPETFIEEVSKAKSELAGVVQKMLGVGEVYKGAVAPHSVPFVSDEVSWDGDKARQQLRKWASSDGPGDPDKIDWDKFRLGFAWYDEENKETISAYKLPHHYAVNGELKTCWRGVVAAMAALMGTRGGVDIPEKDLKGVYAHLARHYKEHGDEPPEFDSWDKGEAFEYYIEKMIYEPVVKEMLKIKKFVEDVLPSLKTSEVSGFNAGDTRREEGVKIKIKKGGKKNE